MRYGVSHLLMLCDVIRPSNLVWTSDGALVSPCDVPWEVLTMNVVAALARVGEMYAVTLLS